jgi:3-oxoacyl-[acyl-carrier-protein] synthase II
MTAVAVTGIGAVTPVGNNAESTWRGLVEGRSGVGPITTFDASTFPVRIAGMVEGYDVESVAPDSVLTRDLHRAGTFGLGAAIEALRDAGLDEDSPYAAEERGIAMGGQVGRCELQEVSDIGQALYESDRTRLMRRTPHDVLRTHQNLPSAAIAHVAGAEGPMIGTSTACTASAHAIGEASRRIEEGEARMMLAGGHDALTTWLDVLGFSLLGALTTKYNDDPEHASRPFDANRSGFVLGEGAVLLVLEEWDAAKARGARILAEVAGYGASMNAYRMTDPPPDGSGPAIAIAAALADAGLSTADVDYVVAHGTGTPSGDVSETAAIRRALGDDADRVLVTSPKSMTGHTTAAAGALSALAAIYAMRDGTVSPTVNLDTPDPDCDLDYVPNEAREREIRAAVVNAFAFGGTNACLVLRNPELADVPVASRGAQA